MSCPVRIGDRIKDNDPRVGERVLVIQALLPNEAAPTKVLAGSPFGGRPVSILLARVHTDGKPRRTGFSLLRN